MRVRIFAALAALCTFACTPIVLAPSPSHPVSMCSVTCSRGGRLMFERQHLCAGGSSRYMQDIRVTGRRTERNEDGTIKADVWIAAEGDYPVTQVETQSCSGYVDQLRRMRPAEESGTFPGESPDGKPNPH